MADTCRVDELTVGVTRAEHLLEAGRYREALGALSGMLAHEDERVWALVTRAHIGLEEWDAALGASHRYAALAPHDPWAPLLHSLARAGRHEFRQALHAAEHARRLDPDLAEAHAHWAWAAAHLGRSYRRPALAAAQHAVSLSPNSADIHNLAGMVALQARNRPRAEAGFREALRIQPDHDAALHNLGLHEVSRGRFAEAGRRFSESAQLDPAAPQTMVAFRLLLHRWLFITHLTLAGVAIVLLPLVSLGAAWAFVAVVAVLAVLTGWTTALVLRSRGRVLRAIGHAMRSSGGLSVWVAVVVVAYLMSLVSLLPTSWADSVRGLITLVLVIGVFASWSVWGRGRRR